jgi:hypothetical protein
MSSDLLPVDFFEKRGITLGKVVEYSKSFQLINSQKHPNAMICINSSNAMGHKHKFTKQITMANILHINGIGPKVLETFFHEEDGYVFSFMITEALAACSNSIGISTISSYNELITRMHALKYIHGELDDQRVMVDAEGNPKIPCNLNSFHRDDPEVSDFDMITLLDDFNDRCSSFVIEATSRQELIDALEWTDTQWMV